MGEAVKQLLFRVTRDDCDWQTFRSPGPGGQNVNKVETGVRVIHRRSGAIGESREHNSQMANRRAAFGRMAKTSAFTSWHRREVARLMGFAGISWTPEDTSAARVIAALEDEANCRVEMTNFLGDWEELL